MITGEWQEALRDEFRKPYYRTLYERVSYEYSHNTVYPPSDELFKAFELTPLERVKVVILGQDPYHEPGQAEGLCFSVKKGVEIPPSLKNIYKELEMEYGFKAPDHGSLVGWAEQGVLLLNTLLTVRAHAAFSHKGIGWEQFTDACIEAVNKVDRPIVFMLWGKPAGEKAAMLNNNKHLVLRCPHPSPLSASRGFFGCGHFKKCNEFLIANGEEPIDWEIK
ncbi:MAG: uracil-DNA glycosylase [Eubacteriales bacterium]|nr:uracil-DNA glycosylase [Eubacteriales bacterium]